MNVEEVIFVGGSCAQLRRVVRDLKPAGNGVTLRTLYSFVSTGTERAKLTGLQVVDYPYLAGNRAVCEVMAVGETVTDVVPGDVVLTHTPHVSHVLSEGFRARVPDGVPLPQAAASALALVAITALRVSPPQLGDIVVVVGLGPVGMIAAQLYEAAGATVVGVDTDPGRLEVGRDLGVSHLVRGGEKEVAAEVLRHTGPEGARIVVEATGVPAVFQQCFDFARQGGDLVMLGSPRGALVEDITPTLERMHLWRTHSSVTVKGAHEWRFPFYRTPFTRHSIEENAAAIFSLIRRGRLDLSRVVDHVVPASDAPSAYAEILDKPGQWSGVLFDWTRS